MIINYKKNNKKNERVCRDIYQNRKSTGTRWLWQQNEIPKEELAWHSDLYSCQNRRVDTTYHSVVTITTPTYTNDYL